MLSYQRHCFCLPEKEQAINRAGIVQQDVQPPGIPLDAQLGSIYLYYFENVLQDCVNYVNNNGSSCFEHFNFHQSH